MNVGGRSFRLQKVIGRGAFGVVWRARERGASEDVAVKVVLAKDSTGFATAAFEAELLEMLTAASEKTQEHVPQYIAHSATRNGLGGLVRLAMTFVPGGSLDTWLYGISDEEHKTVDVAQLVDGHLPGGQQGSWSFASSCHVARTLLTQMSGVFANLSRVAYHRDVASHNVLVDFAEGTGLRPNFSLIDFGLAVRSGTWSREWRNSNLAGDPRYWAPSAWMAFAFGFKYVATHPNPGFQEQYLTRMDHFSLGVLGLEVLFALWNAGEAYEGNHPGLLEVRAAWCKFWVIVIHLFQMFHRQGASDVRQFIAQSRDEGITCLVGHLRQLRQYLRVAASHAGNGCAALFRVLADLIDEGGTVNWTEIPEMLREDVDAPFTMETQESALPRSSASLLHTHQSVRGQDDASQPHRRIRSTGGTVDQELRRIEPAFGETRVSSPTRSSHWAGGNSAGVGGDCLSRSCAHRGFDL